MSNIINNRNLITSGIDVIRNGYRGKTLKDVLTDMEFSSSELYTLLRDVKQSLDLKDSDFNKIVETVKEVNPGVVIDDVFCYECGKKMNWLRFRNSRFVSSLQNDGIIEDKPLCNNCDKKLRGLGRWCNMHSCFAPKNLTIYCPLFDKCPPTGICGSVQCMDFHCKNLHATYNLRKWKNVNKFITPKDGKIIKSDLKVGVEIEAIGKSSNILRKNIFELDRNIGIGDDMSLSRFTSPIEVQTPLASKQKLERLIQSVTDCMKKDGFIVNNACGLHIHIDLESKYGKVDSNDTFYKNLLVAYLLTAENFHKMLPVGRLENRFALRINRLFQGSELGLLYKTMKVRNLWYLTHNDSEVKKRIKQKRDDRKYTDFNFHSLFRGNGLEIRSLEGTLNSDLIINWINFHLTFIEGVADKNIQDKIGVVSKWAQVKDGLFDEILRAGCGNNNERLNTIFDFIKERASVHQASCVGEGTERIPSQYVFPGAIREARQALDMSVGDWVIPSTTTRN